MRYDAVIDGRTIPVEIVERDGRTFVRIGGEEREADFHRVRGAASWSLIVDGRSHEIAFESRPDGVAVTLASESYVVEVVDERTRALRLATGGARARAGAAVIRSMMPGIVRAVLVQTGDAVAAGQPLVILEAMKMENEVRAPGDGIVKSIAVTPGATVTKCAPLLELTS